MAKWKWEGLNREGNRASGQIDAKSSKDARTKLRAQGIRPKRIIAPSILEFDLGEYLVDKGVLGSFSNQEIVRFTKQLAIMISAGVPLIQSLELIYKSQKNLAFKKAIQNVAKGVTEGQTIAESLGKEKGFSKLYVSLIRAGEAGGILDEILNKLSEHLEKQERTKAQIKSAMTYPTVVVIVGIAVVWALMVFVVPQFVSMLTDTGQKIPMITQLVIDTSDFLGTHSLIGIPALIVLATVINEFRKTPTGKPLFDRFFMKMPIFGEIIIKGNLSSFTRTLSTMVGSGVALTDSLDICIDTIDNSVICNDLKVIKKSVLEGKTMTDPMKKIDYFPDMVAQMIGIGEQTGNIDGMLLKVADVFEEEVNRAVENMTKLIEPIIIVVLGGIIAVILVAMYLPMFMAAGGAE